jgi:hypothetical protein
MAIDRESTEQRNSALERQNQLLERQLEALSRASDLSNTLLDTLKEELGIRTRRTTNEQSLLEINKKINKEINNQKFGLSNTATVSKQIQKNNELINASLKTARSISSAINREEQIKARSAANYFSLLNQTQKELDDIEKQLQAGNEIDYERLRTLKDQQKTYDEQLDSVLAGLSTDGKRLATTLAQKTALESINEDRKEELATLEQIEHTLGVTGKILNLISKVPGLGKFAQDAYSAVMEEQKALKEAGKDIMDQYQTIEFASRKLGEGIKDTLNDPLTVGIFLFEEIGRAASEVDSRVTGLQKQLGLGRVASAGISFDFKQLTYSTNDAFITTQKLYESFSAFSGELGFAVDYSGQTLETFTTLNKRLGLATKEAAALTTLFKLQGDDTEDQLGNLTKQIGAFNTLNGKAFDTKQTLNEIASTSASIQVSLKLSAEELAAAVLESKKLGLNLEQVDKIADSLLQFETSITNELKAELLIGKDINLERARLLAINNDLEGVAKELADQNIGFFEFSKMNRIQQQAIAEAMGMSRDEMSQMLLNQQRQLMTNEEISAQLEGQELANFKQLTFQESLNTALEKMRDIFSTIAEGPLGIIAGFFANILSNSIVLHSVLGALTATMGILAIKSGATLVKSIGIAISEIFGANAKLGPLGLAVAGASVGGLFAALSQASGQAQSVQDGIAPSSKGPFTIMDSYGGMAVTAQGDNIVASPNINRSSGVSNDEQRRTNMLLEKLLAKDSNLYMDSQRVGTVLSMGKSRL